MEDRMMENVVSSPVALLVVDVTEYLCDSRYPNSCQSVRDATVHIARLQETARGHGIPIFYTHGGKRYFINRSSQMPDLLRGSWWWKNDWELVDEWGPENEEHAISVASAIAPLNDEAVIFKTKPSAFFGTPLQSYLTALGVRSLFITGAHTSACVRATVTDAFSHNYRVIIPAQAVADRRPEAHEYHLEEMKRSLAWVVDMEEALDLMRKAAK